MYVREEWGKRGEKAFSWSEENFFTLEPCQGYIHTAAAAAVPRHYKGNPVTFSELEHITTLRTHTQANI